MRPEHFSRAECLNRTGRASSHFFVSKFHRYIYNQGFTIITDRKLLFGLFKEDRAISAIVSDKIQRWALILTNYHYQLVYKPGSKFSNTEVTIEDYISPLPCPENVVISMSVFDSILVKKKLLFTHPEISYYHKKCKLIQQGWPGKEAHDFQPYTNEKDELSVQLGCAFW